MNGWEEVFAATGRLVLSRAELSSYGATGRSLTSAVRVGTLARVRRDHYALPTLARQTARAVRVGGRLGCTSALASYGVFVFDEPHPHIHIKANAARLRAPDSSRRPLTRSNRSGAVLHWRPLIDLLDGDEYRVGLRDALAQAVLCQHAWHAVASIDNALHQGLISEFDVADMFNALPEMYAGLQTCIDKRAEAGQETVLRMIARDAGLRYDLQRMIDGVGRVDMLVEDCLVCEADSRAHHDGSEAHVRDRGRDLAAAELGYASLRPAYQHTMHHPERVRDAMLGLVTGTRRLPSA